MKILEELLSKYAFYGVLNMPYMRQRRQRHFQQVWRRNVHITTLKFLLLLFCISMNIIYISQWMFGDNSKILCYSNVFARRQKRFNPESIFKQTRIKIVYRENMTSFLNYIKATLRALFAWCGSYYKQQ